MLRALLLFHSGVLLHEYGDQSTYYFHHLLRQATVISHLQQHADAPLADLCTDAGRQQANSIIVSFFSADSPTGMFRRAATDATAQQTLLSSIDRQLLLDATLIDSTGSVVAYFAWLLDVWSIQGIHPQTHTTTGQLPPPMLPGITTAADYQPCVSNMPNGSYSSELALQALACHHRASASGLSLNPVGS